MSYGYGMGSDSGPVVSPDGPNGSYPVHHQVYSQAQDIPPPQGATSISLLLEQIMNITDQVNSCIDWSLVNVMSFRTLQASF